MGPFVVSIPSTPLSWLVVVISMLLAAAVAYEVALVEPWRWPRWMGLTARFVYHWYPRVVVPTLIAFGWLWS